MPAAAQKNRLPMLLDAATVEALRLGVIRKFNEHMKAGEIISQARVFTIEIDVNDATIRTRFDSGKESFASLKPRRVVALDNKQKVC